MELVKNLKHIYSLLQFTVLFLLEVKNAGVGKAVMMVKVKKVNVRVLVKIKLVVRVKGGKG